jgi:hypothetical protein
VFILILSEWNGINLAHGFVFCFYFVVISVIIQFRIFPKIFFFFFKKTIDRQLDNKSFMHGETNVKFWTKLGVQLYPIAFKIGR